VLECDFEFSKSHPGVLYAILDFQNRIRVLEYDFGFSKSHPGAKKNFQKQNEIEDKPTYTNIYTKTQCQSVCLYADVFSKLPNIYLC